ncbi:MAG: DUF3179 domain-containing protein [Bacteroidales bacterium]|jgi:hypothetical protein|nr:DUF3179 domain-containing protein [Bacteroidales bacterium]
MKPNFKSAGIVLLLLFASNLFAQIQNPRNVEYVFKTDTTKSIVDLSEIILVLPRRTFPIIDTPAFVNKEIGLKSFIKTEPVIVVEIDGKAKAYSMNMFSSHELSNDVLAGVPILPSYCPLCNSAVVYDRRLNVNGEEKVLTFEVSGMLRHSGMVIFDTETESWWQQSMGKAIVGELVGKQLKVIPSLILSVEEFFTNYPNGQILSKETGHVKSMERYGKNVYRKYDSIGNLPYARYFKVDEIDMRLPAMERLIDIRDGEFSKIYPFSILKEKGVINDTFRTKNITIFFQDGARSHLDVYDLEDGREIGTATVFNSKLGHRLLSFKKDGGRFYDLETKSEWTISGKCIAGSLKGKQLEIETHSNHFAFSWLKFHPDTEIYQD